MITVAVRAVLVSVVALAAVTCGAQIAHAGCDDAPRESTKDERAATFAAVEAACVETGASSDVCAALAAVTWRESRGVATVRHTRGRNEDGAGPHGISWRYHGRRLLPDGATPDDLCDARTSTLLVLRMWRSWIDRGARTWIDLQRAYSGRRWSDASRPRADRRWCALLDRYGVDCLARPEVVP